jgi:hypothetical protein
MPTTEHDVLVDMFRDNPPLAPHLVEKLFGLNVPGYKEVCVGDSTLNQTKSVEFRADLALELRDAQQDAVLSIILEVQRDDDPGKKWSWPVYATAQRSRKRCPTIVLVVATDTKVAEWAAKPIDVGLGLTVMRPLVLGPSLIPVITDPEVAEREPELAVLSALSHADGEFGTQVVQTLVQALVQSKHEHLTLYLTLVYDHVRAHLKRAIEVMIMEQKAQDKILVTPPFMQALLDEGAIINSRSTLLRLLNRAGIELTEEQRGHITTCTDPRTFERWTDNIIGAKTAADVFGAD